MNGTAPLFGSGMQSCDMANKYTGICSIGGTGSQLMTCAAPIRYTGTICQEELKSLKNCLLSDPGDSEDVYPLIATDSNLEAVEALFPYIDKASPACAAEVRPFLCLYFFGLCDTAKGVSYQPSASHCRNLRDDVCAEEWTLVQTIGQVLPNVPALTNCDVEFSDETVPCNSVDGSGEEGNDNEIEMVEFMIWWEPYMHTV